MTLWQSQTAGLASGVNRETGQPTTAEEREGVESLAFECEWRAERPEMGDGK